METKVCSVCGLEKDINDFVWRVKGVKRNSACRECTRNSIRKHFYANKEYYRKKTKKRNHELREINREKMYEYLLNHSCVDCGEKDILVLDFDHLNNKRFNVSQMVPTHIWESILIEIEKCEVRCSNCHRRKTAKQKSNWFYRRLHN